MKFDHVIELMHVHVASSQMAHLWLSVKVVSGCTVLFGSRIINCFRQYAIYVVALRKRWLKMNAYTNIEDTVYCCASYLFSLSLDWNRLVSSPDPTSHEEKRSGEPSRIS